MDDRKQESKCIHTQVNGEVKGLPYLQELEGDETEALAWVEAEARKGR